MRNLTLNDIATISKSQELLNEFNIDSDEFIYEINCISVNYDLSVVEEINGEIVGVLILGDFDITVGSPILRFGAAYYKSIANKKGINGYMFFIKKPYRGTGLDERMLAYIKNRLKEYDYIWAGVGNRLKSQNYWLRHGFKKIFDFNDIATFYILTL